jgi:hypothetical protein
MRFVLVPVAGYVLLYVPGHYLLRRAGGDPARGGSHLLREVLLSACCTSWIGFVLAELGCFSLPLLLGLSAGLALVGFRLSRHAPHIRYTRRDASGLALFLLAGVWAAPPMDTRMMGADSTGYLASGEQLARHGTLVIHDPTLPGLSVDLKRSLFPSVAPDRGAPPYLRLNGSLILRSLDRDEVLPAFHHLIAVWIAAADALAGSNVGEWVITLFGALSIWAMAECAALMCGVGVAYLVLPLLLVSGIQYWYSRFVMPEVPGQFFVWGGLACAASSERTGRDTDAALAGLAFGIAGLMRLENAVFLAGALAVVSLVPGASRHRYGLLVASAAIVWLHAAIHLAVFRTHYFGVLRSLLILRLPGVPSRHLGLAVLVVGLTGAFLVWRRQRVRQGLRVPAFDHCVVVALLLMALAGGYHMRWPNLPLLLSCVGAPTLVGGGVGLLLLRGNTRTPLAWRLLLVLTALVFAQVMLDPHAQPVPIWAARRALTVVLPAACLGLAILSRAVAKRWHWTAGAALLCAAIWGEARLFWQLRSESNYYQGATRHVQAIAALVPAGSLLLFDGQLVTSGLPPTLWAQRDLPAYFFSAADTSRVTELATSSSAAAVFWISDGSAAPPHGPGIEVTPVALYEFVITTPRLDVGAPLGSAVNWQSTIALYRIRFTGDPRK